MAQPPPRVAAVLVLLLGDALHLHAFEARSWGCPSLVVQQRRHYEERRRTVFAAAISSALHPVRRGNAPFVVSPLFVAASSSPPAESKVKSRSSSSKSSDSNYQFFDTAKIHVAAGHGGNGCVSFRREKGEARGGPNGGNGGRGGSIRVVCDATMNTLLPCRQQTHYRAGAGRNGQGKLRHGVAGHDVTIRVPPGTAIRELHTQQLAGELQHDGATLLVGRGGRGGRGNAAFKTARQVAPRLAERGEPGPARWLSLELKLIADVGLLGQPNVGKSTLLSACSAARPKIANYPFTTIVPQLGVCDLGDGAGLVLCDVPGLIAGAAQGAGMGDAFLRHVQRCAVLLHVVDGTSDDPVQDFAQINAELAAYDALLARKPQVVVLNKMDIPAVAARADALMQELQQAAGHSRVLAISAATQHNVAQLMTRLKKFVDAQPSKYTADSVEASLSSPAAAEVDFDKTGLDHDSDDYVIVSDPSYPNQWRIQGVYIEQVAAMTHWEYPEAVERFGRQLQALGVADALTRQGAVEGDLVMVGAHDFDFAPGLTNPYIPDELLEDELLYDSEAKVEAALDAAPFWRPYAQGGYLDVDTDELAAFDDDADWDLLLDDGDDVDSYDDDTVPDTDDEVRGA